MITLAVGCAKSGVTRELGFLGVRVVGIVTLLPPLLRTPGAVETRLPHAVPLHPAAHPAGSRRHRQGPGDPRPAPPTHRAPPPSPTSQAPTRRPSAARCGQPRATPSPLVLLLKTVLGVGLTVLPVRARREAGTWPSPSASVRVRFAPTFRVAAMRLGDERATAAALGHKPPMSTSQLHPMASDLKHLPSHIFRAHLHGQQPGGHPLHEAPLPDRLGVDAGQVPKQAAPLPTQPRWVPFEQLAAPFPHRDGEVV